MRAPFQIPQRFGHLLGRFDEVRRAFQVLNALQNLRVIARLPDGTLVEGVVNITNGEAIVDLTQAPRQPLADPARDPTADRAQHAANRNPSNPRP